MPRRGPVQQAAAAAMNAAAHEKWDATLRSEDPIVGVAGPGRWLLAEFAPVSLFSLKTSQATSGVGRTLVVPTPYAMKMACVDAAFRAGLSDAACAEFLEQLAPVEARVCPPAAALVTHTIVKIRQEPKQRRADLPFISSVAYREVVHHAGRWWWAFDLAAGDEVLAERLVATLPHVRSVGKRGSFLQFLSFKRAVDLDETFTAPVVPGEDFRIVAAWHLQQLDDFGPEATFARLSTFSTEKSQRGKHRIFTPTLIPLGLVRSGPGFSEYRSSR